MTQHRAWRLGLYTMLFCSALDTMLCSGHWLQTALDTVLGTRQHHALLSTLALNGTRHSTPCSALTNTGA